MRVVEGRAPGAWTDCRIRTRCSWEAAAWRRWTASSPVNPRPWSPRTPAWTGGDRPAVLDRGRYAVDGVQLASRGSRTLPGGTFTAWPRTTRFSSSGENPVIGLVATTAAGPRRGGIAARALARTRTSSSSPRLRRAPRRLARVRRPRVLPGRRARPCGCSPRCSGTSPPILRGLCRSRPAGSRSPSSAAITARTSLPSASPGALGATAVITTATDAAGIAGLDTLGWPYEGDVAAVTRAMLDGEPVALWQDGGRVWPLPALPRRSVDALPGCRTRDPGDRPDRPPAGRPVRRAAPAESRDRAWGEPRRRCCGSARPDPGGAAGRRPFAGLDARPRHRRRQGRRGRACSRPPRRWVSRSSPTPPKRSRR